MELYRVIVKVYPTTESGEAAWKAQFGWVVGWVQSSSGEAAAENFQLFIDSLGTYERLSPSLVLALEESAHPLPDPKYDQYREAGRRNQPNLFVRWLAAGVEFPEEENFLDCGVFPSDLVEGTDAAI